MIIGVSLQGKACSKCEEVKLFSEFNKNKDSKDGYRSECKTCGKKYRAANVKEIKVQTAKYRAANPEKVKEIQAKYRASNPEKIKERQAKWRAANPEKGRESCAKYRAANSEEIKEYRAANVKKIKVQTAKYQKANPEKFRAYCAKRRAAKLLAIPSWLTKEDYQAMEAICKEADRLTQETGIKMHVDHIHPLQGKLVCGFHCPSNLQILTESENCSKGNKFTPYVESELLV